MAQSIHAALEFVKEHPSIAVPWQDRSNYLTVLESASSNIPELIESLVLYGTPHTVFREPDLEDRITAIAVAPHPILPKKIKSLKLAGSSMKKIAATRERLVLSYNKGHSRDPTIPPWVAKFKGNTHYLHHIESTTEGFSTKETPDNEHTKGSVMFRCNDFVIKEDNGKFFGYLT